MFLILGASGTVGSRVAQRLLQGGETVRAVSRDPKRLSDLTARGAIPIRGDLRSDEWMTPALDGVRTVVLATHGLVPPRRDNHPGVTDASGNRRIIDAAVRARVEHIVFVSATVGADSPVLFGQVKYQAEQYLKGSGIAHTIIRPTVFVETHALLLMGEPLRKRASVLLFGPGTTRLNWISADDVADFITRAIQQDWPRNRIFTIGGPDTLSRLEVLDLVQAVVGTSARRWRLPVALMRAVKLLGGRYNPGLRYLLDMAIMESTLPNDTSWAPPALDWIGPTTVREVLDHWSRQVVRHGSSSSKG